MGKYRRRFNDRLEDRDPTIMWMDYDGGYVVPHEGRYLAVGPWFTISRGPDILMQTQFVALRPRRIGGHEVIATTPGWIALREELLANPALAMHFPGWHRKFEEFLAGGYKRANWNDVILTPPSNDGGYDISAEKRGRLILDEAKAYSSCRRVTHVTVRAALGLHIVNPEIAQARVTTTSRFAPTVWDEFRRHVPEKLALRDLSSILKWLRSMERHASQ